MWHWKLEPLISLSVWLAITPATVENGCVEVIPGTHTQEIPIIQRNDANLAAWFGGQCADPNYFNESDKVAMVMAPGQFFLFNEATLHHSNPNRTQERRRLKLSDTSGLIWPGQSSITNCIGWVC
jgi:ectoine hydroxylase-related dioxygenase (phytanoyl-CoA dioxygenase family)